MAATRIDPLDFCKDYDPAASKDHGEARTIPFVPPNIPIIRQPKRPSFAEALQGELARMTNEPMASQLIHNLYAAVHRARAAAGE